MQTYKYTTEAVTTAIYITVFLAFSDLVSAHFIDYFHVFLISCLPTSVSLLRTVGSNNFIDGQLVGLFASYLAP